MPTATLYCLFIQISPINRTKFGLVSVIATEQVDDAVFNYGSTSVYLRLSLQPKCIAVAQYGPHEKPVYRY